MNLEMRPSGILMPNDINAKSREDRVEAKSQFLKNNFRPILNNVKDTESLKKYENYFLLGDKNDDAVYIPNDIYNAAVSKFQSDFYGRTLSGNLTLQEIVQMVTKTPEVFYEELVRSKAKVEQYRKI